MKGAKGGLRDRKISENYRKYNKSSLQEELEAIRSHRIHDGLNLNTNENGINEVEDLFINEEGIGSTILSRIIAQNIYSNKKVKEAKILLEEIPIVVDELVENTSVEYQPEEQVEQLQEEKEQSVEKEEETELKETKTIEEDSIKKDKEQKEKVEIHHRYRVGFCEEDIIEDVYEYDNVVEEEENLGEVEEEYTNETKLEQEILLEFERMLREDYYEIKDLEYQLQVLTSAEEDVVLQDEIEDLKKQLEEILEKFEILKDKYEELKNSSDFSNLILLDNNYLQNLVTDYKKSAQDSIDMDNLIKRVQEAEDYISVIEKIIYIEDEKDYLEDKIDDKKEEFEDRDKTFEELEQQYEDIEKINDEIEKYSINLDGILKDITKKVDNMGEIHNKIETHLQLVPDINRIARVVADFTASTIIPRTRRGNIARAALIVDGIRNLRNAFSIERRTEERQVAQYVNYAKEIGKNIDTINDFKYNIDDATKNITDIRDTLKDELKDYINLVPEFKELMDNLDKIEKSLEEQKYYISRYGYEMQRELERNNAKVLVYKNV